MRRRIQALLFVLLLCAGFLTAIPVRAEESPIHLSSGYYVIRSRINKNYVLGIADSSLANTANLQLQKANTSPYQTFYIEANKDVCVIRNAVSDRVLDVEGGRKEDKTNVRQYNWNGSKAQKWKSVQNDDGSVSFLGVGSGKALDVAGGRAANGTNVRIYRFNRSAAQKWELVSVPNPNEGPANGCYSIRSAGDTGYALDVENGKQDNKANIRIYRSNNSNAQKYYIARHSGNLYRVWNANSLKAMDVAGGSRANGANVQQYSWNASAAQLWRILQNADGTWTFLSSGSGKALDIAGGRIANKTNVRMYSSNGTPAQRWVLKGASARPLSVPANQGDPARQTSKYVQIIAKGSTSYDLRIATEALNNKEPVKLWEKSSGTEDKWVFLDQGDGSYRILNAQSGLSLDDRGGSSKNGAIVQQYRWNGTAAQKWQAVETGDLDGSFYLICQANGNYLDISGGRHQNGTKIQLYRGNGTNSQKFFIRPAQVTTNDMVYVNGERSVIRNGKVEAKKRPTFSLSGISNAFDDYGVVWNNRNANGVPYDVQNYANRFSRYDADFYGNTGKKVLYLTFNDGEGNEAVLNGILNTLRAKNVKATFFISGSLIRNHSGIVRRIINDGHQIGNHSWTHPCMPHLSAQGQANEIRNFNQRMRSDFGYECELFRFPSGEFSELGLAVVNNEGMKSVFYTFAYRDYDRHSQPGITEAYNRVTAAIQPGAILCLHSNSTTNNAILGRVIDEARRRGFSFASYYPEYTSP